MRTPATRVAGERQLPELLLCGGIAASASLAVVLKVPAGGDLAAHLYRTELVRHGVLVWDNLWFAGQYPLASYSLLYYLVAAVVGNGALGVASGGISAAIFASIAQHEWRAAGRWPARVFALLVVGQVFTAAYPYDAGVAMLLATLWALQRRRPWLAGVCTVLTVGFSPLAFLFLALAMVALGLPRRHLNRQVLVVAGAIGVAGGIEIAALVLLPTPGLVYPYGTWSLLAGLGVCGLGVALALRGRGGRPLASLFLVWALASVVADVVPSPVGHNLARASVFAVPLVLAAAALANFRPRWLATLALAAAVAANVVPYTLMVTERSSSADSRLEFWRPVLTFLHRHSSAGFRVEVVPTANHWEAFYFPTAGFALARGWYRQLDTADNPQLYARRLTPAAYRAWLRRRGVRYVVLPNLSPEAIDGRREAALVSSGRAGLREVWSGAAARVYELSDPTPILTGPGPAAITLLTSARLAGWVARPGRYLLRIRYTPYTSVSTGTGCLEPAGASTTALLVRRPGPFAIVAIETPGGVLASALDPDRSRCRMR